MGAYNTTPINAQRYTENEKSLLDQRIIQLIYRYFVELYTMLNEAEKKEYSPCIGIVGSGQLARMLAMAALQLGCTIQVLERKQDSPAVSFAQHTLIGDWDDPAALRRLAAITDVITLENEFVDAAALSELEQAGHTLLPSAHSIKLVQDKYKQKQILAAAGLPLVEFRAIDRLDDIAATAAVLGWPLVIKSRRNSYDGKSNATVKSAADIEWAWNKLGGGQYQLYAEAFCPFTTELSIIITTALNGETAVYPLVESLQYEHICHTIRAPAPVPKEIADNAITLAKKAVAAVSAVGSFGVELFLSKQGQVLINELAPRVHNSGHYTIEACICSQFENHIRAILGWPLGSTQMVKPAAVMINLLGQGDGSRRVDGLEQALAIAGVHLHDYGKEDSSKRRKMGHITVLGDDLQTTEKTAQQAADLIRFGVNACTKNND